MSRVDELSCEFVTTIPDELAAATLYVSMEYATVVHKCCCGCGNEVVTPLSPTDWRLTYDGEGVSLHPSIGNWSFRCRSHYWVRGNQIQWAGPMSDAQVRSIRLHDLENKAAYLDTYASAPQSDRPAQASERLAFFPTIWGVIRKWLGR
jgi:hypothetical protein